MLISLQGTLVSVFLGMLAPREGATSSLPPALPTNSPMEMSVCAKLGSIVQINSASPSLNAEPINNGMAINVSVKQVT